MTDDPVPNPWPRRLLAAALLTLCLGAGAWLFLPELFRIETDDAYVESHVETVSARIPGYVQSLAIDDNSKVGQGDLLLELDPRDYRAKADGADADLVAARGRLAETQARVAVADAAIAVDEAQVEAAAATARLAADDLQRFQGVSDVRAVSSQRIDTARSAAASSHAALDAAKRKVQLDRADSALARAQIATAQAGVKQAEAALEQARLNLSYTRLVAAEAGSVANKLVEPGAYVQAGQPLLSLVPMAVYVVANFKETQLDGVVPGRAVSLSIDALPGKALKGHVDSIQRGSGSRFALLPPENATGNFVKIVQRLPVKILLDEPPELLARLAPGMSAIVTIRR